MEEMIKIYDKEYPKEKVQSSHVHAIEALGFIHALEYIYPDPNSLLRERRLVAEMTVLLYCMHIS